MSTNIHKDIYSAESELIDILMIRGSAHGSGGFALAESIVRKG
jgi:hypothetical protein